jgi:class 3 adenylate cyclase
MSCALTSAMERNGGHVFKTISDTFCVAFDRAGDALAAVVQAQQTLHYEEWHAPSRSRRLCS